jgi:hypothetical protein
MRRISTKALLLAGVLATAAAPASAATIVLNNTGGVEVGTQAYQGFTTAANFWASQISNNITIRLDVGFGHLGPNILGSTGSAGAYVPTQAIEQQLIATGTSSLDAVAKANLPTLSGGALDVVIPGFNAGGLGVNTDTLQLDTDNSFNNTALFGNTANLKALGFGGLGGVTDGSISFSSDFNFDFNPTDGVAANGIDFIGVAIHEIGHALGFVSGVDIYDLIGSPNGFYDTGHPEVCGVPCEAYDAQADAFAGVFDLFRYADVLGDKQLTWAPGVESYFSIDGGATSLGAFATGDFNGDGWQASHWKRKQSGQDALGIMDPAVSFGQLDVFTNRDFQAFDAMGFNFNFDTLTDPHAYTSADISRLYRTAPLPEPSEWALMLAGFGLLGATLRRRRQVAVTA